MADADDKVIGASVLTGSLVGLGTGYVLHKPWQLNKQSALLASVYGIEGLVIGGTMNLIL